MNWYIYKNVVICSDCRERLGLDDNEVYEVVGKAAIQCAHCGKASFGDKVAGFLWLSKSGKPYIYCVNCMEKVNKEDFVGYSPIPVTQEVDAPICCDLCSEPLSVRLTSTAETALSKSIEVLEMILYDGRLRDVRPALWEKVYNLKKRLDDIRLVVADETAESATAGKDDDEQQKKE